MQGCEFFSSTFRVGVKKWVLGEGRTSNSLMMPGVLLSLRVESPIGGMCEGITARPLTMQDMLLAMSNARSG